MEKRGITEYNVHKPLQVNICYNYFVKNAKWLRIHSLHLFLVLIMRVIIVLKWLIHLPECFFIDVSIL